MNYLPLDFILLSHFHGDHFDQVAIKDLDKSIPIITTPHAASELKSSGLNKVDELAKLQEMSFLKDGIRLNITATPGIHGPFPISIFMPQVMGSILDFYSENKSLLFRIYITGDTLVFDDIKDIPKRFPNSDIALLHLGGGTIVMGIMVTMDSKEGLKMFKIIDPKKAILLHYNDYDVFKSSIDDFKKDALDAGVDGRIHYLNHAESYTFEIEKNVK